MKTRKIMLQLFILSFVLIGSILFPSCSAAITNIWEPTKGTVKSYSYDTKYTGSISNEVNNALYTFTVLNVWDNDANNYTELLYSQELSISGTSNIVLNVLEDEGTNWDYNYLIDIFYSGDLGPLCPIGYSAAGPIGMNWTAQIETINGLMNYTATIDNTVLIIHHWTTDTDAGAHVIIDVYIKWAMVTGWLLSYEEILNYGDPANFVRTDTIELSVEQVAPDITLLLGIIGAICGGLAIGITYYIWKKRS